jgi:hypothetical protein
MCWTISLKPATRPIGGDRRRLCCQQRLLPERLLAGYSPLTLWMSLGFGLHGFL